MEGATPRPPLLAVAHGSRDQRSADTVLDLLRVVRDKRPELDVRAAFLELSAPLLEEVLATLYAQGHRRVVVVPLLLGSAYHARVDVPGVVAQMSARFPRLAVSVTDVLGSDPRVAEVALTRLAEAGVTHTETGFGVVLAGAGSSHESANAAVSTIAAEWADRTGWRTTVAFAATSPSAVTAVHTLRAAGAARIAVGAWFLAPGLLPDGITRAVRELDPTAPVAAPLGSDSRMADVVLDRYDTAPTGSGTSKESESAGETGKERTNGPVRGAGGPAVGLTPGRATR